MPKVRFSETVKTKQDRPQTFEAGKVYDLSEDAAARWLVRGKAERVGDAAPPAAADAPAAPKPDPKPKGK